MPRWGDTKDRFWDKVNKKGHNDCWEWTGYIMNGYGRFVDSDVKKEIGAHRYSYKLHFTDPLDKNVCHKCDNTKCVNPSHLFLGTQQDNIKDMMLKNRQNKGEVNGNRILTNAQVLDIRKLRSEGLSVKQLSSQFSTSSDNIYCIINRTTWKHI